MDEILYSYIKVITMSDSIDKIERLVSVLYKEITANESPSPENIDTTQS